MPSRIVVRGPNFLGDCVMATEFFTSLRAQFPDSEITFLGLPVAAEFARLGGWFDVVRVLPDKKLVSVISMARQLRQGNFDLAISLPSSTSAAALFFLAGVKRRVGWAEPTAAWMYHYSERWRGRASGLHKSQLYTQMIRWLVPEALPVAPVPAGPGVQGAYFVLAPGASIALRKWPHSGEFLRSLQRRYPGVAVILVGAASDKSVADSLGIDGVQGVENRIGQTSLAEVVALCREAKAVIAMDSGIAHLSATVAGNKTLVVFGPGDPHYVRPIGARVRTVRVADLPCSPCESAVCRRTHGYQTCLKNLAPETALGALEALLATPA